VTTRRADRSAIARVVELAVADEPTAWSAAGFAVESERVRLGATTVRLAGRHDGRGGVTGWTIAGVADAGRAELDGLPTTFRRNAPADPDPRTAPVHPNGAAGIDHIVVATPDLDRTISAFEALQLPCRRVRDAGAGRQQAFFRCGPTIVEVVGPTRGTASRSDEPARWFGLALDADDLDRSAELLGGQLGPIKAAVQRGRRIATLRHHDLHVSVAVALMDDRADAVGPDRPAGPTSPEPGR